MVSISSERKKALKNKFIYIGCTCSLLLFLILVFYYFFFHTIKVDLNTATQFLLEGESGSATASIKKMDNNYNQRIQPFFDSLTYHIEPSTQLKNGDQVQVTWYYDQELASQYHIEVLSTTQTFLVEGLAERYTHIEEIPENFLSQLHMKGNSYIEKNKSEILDEVFPENLKATYESHTLLHRVFLKAEQKEQKDKIIEIYQLQAHKDAQNLQGYYMIIFDSIHNQQLLDSKNIYGEAIFEEAPLDENQLVKFLRSKYLLSYEITFFPS